MPDLVKQDDINLSRKFWGQTKARKVFAEAIRGKSIRTIAKDLDMTPNRVTAIYRNKRFLERIKDYLFCQEVRKAVIHAVHINKMWKELENRISGVSDTTFLREFDRVLLDKGFKKQLGPNLVALIAEVTGKEGKVSPKDVEKAVKKHLKVRHLKVSDEEKEEVTNQEGVTNEESDREVAGSERDQNQQSSGD